MSFGGHLLGPVDMPFPASQSALLRGIRRFLEGPEPSPTAPRRRLAPQPFWYLVSGSEAPCWHPATQRPVRGPQRTPRLESQRGAVNREFKSNMQDFAPAV